MANPTGIGGRPLGQENKHKRFKAALLRLADADPRKLDELAQRLWETALEGDVPAMREIADRLDGKVPQAVVGDDEHGPIEHIIRWADADDASQQPPLIDKPKT